MQIGPFKFPWPRNGFLVRVSGLLSLQNSLHHINYVHPEHDGVTPFQRISLRNFSCFVCRCSMFFLNTVAERPVTLPSGLFGYSISTALPSTRSYVSILPFLFLEFNLVQATLGICDSRLRHVFGYAFTGGPGSLLYGIYFIGLGLFLEHCL